MVEQKHPNSKFGGIEVYLGMDYLKQLDDVLKFLNQDISKFIIYSKIMMEFKDLSKDHLYLILDKLCDDNYVKKGKDSEWLITYNGVMFLAHGGYAQQLKDVKTKNRRQVLVNVIISLGTGFAGLYAIWKFAEALYHILYPCACY